ncbi:hypothetical protein GCM10011357_01280 [Lacimicrobium alkaliphilum]|uniref:Thiol-disulfide oxidoreductase n=2 Tax=Lacimicrobium alkaliphilum TaxID=1526571 RepID=A0ABQ1QZJ7_9ALTE|nr:hypothetical protein GCM10011357_01280 [Lacimicrobium alkaliphilum]
MAWLAPRLTGKLQMVDISDSDFCSYAGVNKAQMMAVLHLWDGQQFVKGLDASLYYWRLAGFHRLVTFLRLKPCYWLACKAYGYWAKKRQRCTDGVCDGR